jgi:hypothetical protein
MGKSVIIHLMTDGLPTDARGNTQGQMEAVKSWIKNRKMINKVLVCITLCVNDESVHEAYEPLDRGAGVDISAVRELCRHSLRTMSTSFPQKEIKQALISNGP